MMRILLQYLLPLILPTAIYLLWMGFASRNRGAGELPARLRSGPWFWLILAGVVLMGGGLFYTALTTGSDPEGTYVAPRWEGGRIVPGHVE
jgi:hypothetical protein